MRAIASNVLPLNALAVTVYIPVCEYCLVIDCPGCLLMRILSPKSRCIYSISPIVFAEKFISLPILPLFVSACICIPLCCVLDCPTIMVVFATALFLVHCAYAWTTYSHGLLYVCVMDCPFFVDPSPISRCISPITLHLVTASIVTVNGA